MQKIVDLYRGEQGTCTVLLARTATLIYSSPGIWILKCQNEGLLEGHTWIACLSLPCLSIERKSSNPSTGAKQLCRVYPSRAPACLREQRLLPEAAPRGRTAAPGVATRGCSRATQSPAGHAELRPQHAAGPKCWANRKHGTVSIATQQPIRKTAAGTVCVPPAPFRWIRSE